MSVALEARHEILVREVKRERDHSAELRATIEAQRAEIARLRQALGLNPGGAR